MADETEVILDDAALSASLQKLEEAIRMLELVCAGIVPVTNQLEGLGLSSDGLNVKYGDMLSSKLSPIKEALSNARRELSMGGDQLIADVDEIDKFLY